MIKQNDLKRDGTGLQSLGIFFFLLSVLTRALSALIGFNGPDQPHLESLARAVVQGLHSGATE